jgi:hypothetical protein
MLFSPGGFFDRALPTAEIDPELAKLASVFSHGYKSTSLVPSRAIGVT